MANDNDVPEVLANGIGNWPNAAQLMTNFRYLMDMFYASTTAPPNPIDGGIWIKTDEPMFSRYRVWDSDTSRWYGLMLGGPVE